MSQKTNRRSLQFQALEERQVMAGNVTAAIVGRDLQITGDKSGNGVQVKQLNSTTLEITGLTQDGKATTINGKSKITISNPKGHVFANLGDGNDRFDIKGTSSTALKLNGTLNCNLGAGNDTVNVQMVDVIGLLYVDGGLGADTVNVSLAQFNHGAYLRMGAGADKATFDTCYSSYYDLDMGADSDNLTMWEAYGVDSVVKMGSGTDTFSTDRATDKMKANGDAGTDTFIDLSFGYGNPITKSGFERVR